MSVRIGTKSNGIKYLDVMVPDGRGGVKRQRVSCDTRDQKAAEQQRRDWIAGIHPKHPNMGGIVAPKGRVPAAHISYRQKSRQDGMTLHAWLDACYDSKWAQTATAANARSNIKILQTIIDPNLLLTEVSKTHLEAIRDELLRRGYMPGTVKRKLQQVSAALHLGLHTEDTTGRTLIQAVPKMPTLVVENRQERVITYEEEKAIFAAIDARMHREPHRRWWSFKHLVMILFDMGFRLGEALSLGPHSVQHQFAEDPITGEGEDYIALHLPGNVTKNRLPRTIPATQRIIDAISHLNAQAANGRWFPWKRRGSGAWYMWDNIRDDLAEQGFDLSDVRQHTMRHTCATRLCQHGMDIVGLRDWLGHKDISITAGRYIHLINSHLRKGATILDRVHARAGLYGAPPPIRANNGGVTAIQNDMSCGNNCADSGTGAA